MSRYRRQVSCGALALLGCLLLGVTVDQRLAADPSVAPATLPAATLPAAGWPAANGGGGLTNTADPIAPPPYRVRWAYLTNAVDRAGVEAGPSLAGDRVYVADARGTVHALDLNTGKALWTYTADDGFETTPLYSAGMLFLGDLGGAFHAINAETGKLAWKRAGESPIHASANTDGQVILYANDQGDIFAVDREGQLRWQAKAADRVNGAAAVAGPLAYVAGCDANLLALRLADGKEAFTFALPALAPGSAAARGQQVVVATDQGRVVCVSADGKQELWRFQTDEQAMMYASPAVSEQYVVVGGRDRQIRALDARTGKQVWSFRTRGDVDASPIIAGDVVVVVSRDRRLYLLELKTGRKLWEFTAGRAMTATPAVAGGVIVIADSGGNVYCLEPGR